MIKTPEINLEDLKRLKEKLLVEHSFDLNYYNNLYIRRRIVSRLMTTRFDSLSSYLKLLDRDPKEIKNLLDAFTINVTQFFRDPWLWDELNKKFIPYFLEEKKKKNNLNIKIWSVGCATGEETYSIAILLKEHLSNQINNFYVTILGTDIEKEALHIAKTGIYPKESLLNVKKELLNKYFIEIDLEKIYSADIKNIIFKISKHSTGPIYQISDEPKTFVNFKLHNFLTDIPFRYIDIIFCRNVLIYLAPEKRDYVFEKFYNSLNLHGFFVLGSTETIFAYKSKYKFYLLDSKAHIYRKERRCKIDQYLHQEQRKEWWWGYEQK